MRVSAVLEYFHLATAFRIAFSNDEPNSNPFADLSTEDFASLRALMIELILATDMEHHFSLVTKLKVCRHRMHNTLICIQPPKLELWY